MESLRSLSHFIACKIQYYCNCTSMRKRLDFCLIDISNMAVRSVDNIELLKMGKIDVSAETHGHYSKEACGMTMIPLNIMVKQTLTVLCTKGKSYF